MWRTATACRGEWTCWHAAVSAHPRGAFARPCRASRWVSAIRSVCHRRWRTLLLCGAAKCSICANAALRRSLVQRSSVSREHVALARCEILIWFTSAGGVLMEIEPSVAILSCGVLVHVAEQPCRDSAMRDYRFRQRATECPRSFDPAMPSRWQRSRIRHRRNVVASKLFRIIVSESSQE
jgi:hypothetical protein